MCCRFFAEDCLTLKRKSDFDSDFDLGPCPLRLCRFDDGHLIHGPASVLFCLLFGAALAFDAASFANRKVLSQRLELHWTVVGESLRFGLVATVPADGWVGFGLGEQMVNSDMVVASARVFFDAFATLRTVPKKDVDLVPPGKESWTLVKSEVIDGKLMVEGTRPLVADDAWDKPIRGGIVSVVWAVGDVATPHLEFHSDKGVDVVEFMPAQARATCGAAPTANARNFVRTAGDASPLALKTFKGNILVRGAPAATATRIDVRELASASTLLAGVQTTHNSSGVFVAAGRASESSPSNAAADTTASTSQASLAATTTATTTGAATTAGTATSLLDATSSNGVETTTGVVDSASTPLSVSWLLVAFVLLLHFASAQDCRAGDIEASVQAGGSLVAETEDGDIVVSPGTSFANSAMLRTGSGAMHAKFAVSGVAVSIDTGSRADVSFNVTTTGGKLVISVLNVKGTYSVTTAPNAVFKTVGDVTEYSDRPTFHSGMFDYGADVLTVDASSWSGQIEVRGAYAKPLCPDANCESFELRFDKFKVSPAKTSYVCFQFAIPPAFRGKQIMRFDPIVDNPSAVHHMVVQTGVEVYRNGSNCPMVSAIYAWAVGIGKFEAPPEAGLVMTGTYITIQMHYDNPEGRTDFVDSSGMKIYIGDNRPQTAGMLWLGASLQDGIPTGKALESVYGLCVLADITTPITVFGYFAHAHKAARHIWSVHARPNHPTRLPGKTYGAVRNIREPTDPFDFNRQEVVLLAEPFQVLPNDGFLTQCQYDTRGRPGAVVAFGEETEDEMCFNFIYYYPRRKIDGDRQDLCFIGQGHGLFSLP
jgi:hypothetical protein